MLMRTVSNDGAMVEEEDAFSVAEGAEAVGNNKGGASGRDLSEFALDVTLALGIKGSGCLIKDENGGVFNESTSDGNALPLTAGEGATALAYFGVEPVREIAEERGDRGGIGGSSDGVICGTRTSEGNIITNSSGEEESLLPDKSETRAQVTREHIAYVHSVHKHGSGIHIVEARDKRGKGCFARAAGANETDCLSCRDVYGNILEHGSARFVREGNVAELDVAARRIGERERVLRFGHGVGSGKDFLNAYESTLSFIEAVEGSAGLLHRIKEKEESCGNGEEI